LTKPARNGVPLSAAEMIILLTQGTYNAGLLAKFRAQNPDIESMADAKARLGITD